MATHLMLGFRIQRVFPRALLRRLLQRVIDTAFCTIQPVVLLGVAQRWLRRYKKNAGREISNVRSNSAEGASESGYVFNRVREGV